MSKITILGIIILFISYSCNPVKNNSDVVHERLNPKNKFEALIKKLENPENKGVLIAAHRGDWRNAPENSIQAIQNCIDMSIDIVEIDVRLTKDSNLVVIHDRELDRTTNGTGKILDWTLDSLKTLNLRNGCGTVTHHKIPTLEEALEAAKGKIIVNLDKSYDDFTIAYSIVMKYNMLNQVIFKGYENYYDTRNYLGKYLDSILFMPIVRLYDEKPRERVQGFLQNCNPVGFEFTIGEDYTNMKIDFEGLMKNGNHVWMNSLTPKHCAGHTDDVAIANPDSTYNWFVKNNVTVIQSDRPAFLLKYLQGNNLHD